VSTADIAAVFAPLDRELWLVTARHGERRGGLIATCVSQASIVPDLPRVLVGLAKQHFTWELVEESAAFALHLLGEEHLDWVWRFGLQSGRDQDKLLGLAVAEKSSGSPVLIDALGWLDCRVEARLDSGDRTFYLAEVLEGAMTGSAPLTFKRMLQLAPSGSLSALKAALVRDAVVDGEAIRAWREHQSGPSYSRSDISAATSERTSG
jgi:flavin reductase (DIM6/NTAB) family NADH-FMN oxidoreductase RutF